jgi:hypothetical protein
VCELDFGKGFILYQMTVDKACRLRVYATAADRTADAARGLTTPPVNAGVFYDVVATAASTIHFGPMTAGANLEAAPTVLLPGLVQNRSGAAGVVTITFTVLTLENDSTTASPAVIVRDTDPVGSATEGTIWAKVV